jgi:hypothetical protein
VTKILQHLLGLAIAFLMLAMTALGQSVPSFAPPVGYPAPGASAATAGDFDGDGRVDVVTANGVAGSHGVSILLTNSDGSLQAAHNFVTNTDPTAVVAGDFNGDGHLDVAAGDKATNTLSILLGNGDGTLQAATTIGLTGAPISICASDLNGDGKSDLVLVLQTGLTYLDAILLSNGDGTFSQSTFSGPYGVVVADFNGDAKPDLCVYGLGVGPDAAIKFGNGDGTFTDAPAPFTLGVPFEANLALAGDFNGDGKMDLYGEFVSGAVTRAGFVFSTYTALGNGDGTFNVMSTGVTNSGVGGENLLVGDFNRDGKLDVAGVFPGPAAKRLTRTPVNTVRVIYGRGDGTFIIGAGNMRFEFPAGDSTAIFTGAPLVSSDFDGNGAPDFAWASGSGINVIRNANGNPPLLSHLSVNSTFVVGGEKTVSATVTIGDPAPAGGAVIALSSSDPAAAFFPAGSTVTIPESAMSATFDVGTSAVAAVEPVSIAASWNGVNQSASFNVLPSFSVSSVKLASPSLFGLFGGLNSTSATVTLSGPAGDGTVVTLASSNPALVAVPASVSIAPGTTSATFAVRVLTNVPVNTPVTISGSYQGTTATDILTVLAASDTIKIIKADYVVSKRQWTIEATDSDPSNTRIEVLTPAGLDLGTLVPQGGGKFKGQGLFAGPFTSVVLQSFKGGTATGAVAQK